MACSNDVNDIMIVCGGVDANPVYLNTIYSATISTQSFYTDCGDLSVARKFGAGTSNGVGDRGIFGGGATGSSTEVNVIDYVTISSP